MKKTLLTLALGALLGIGLTIGIPAIADVTLNTPLSTGTDAQGVRANSLHVTWKANDETVVDAKVFGLDGGVVQLDAVTTIDVAVPASSGSPTFGVTGYALEDPAFVASCSGSRAAILATTNDIKAKLESFADNCLN